MRELARACGLSVAHTHRTLKALAAAGYIRWERAPKRGSHIALLAKSAPCRNVPSPIPPQKNNIGLTGLRPWSQLPLGEGAIRWALAQVRNDLRSRPSISPARRATVMACLGPEVHRALARGRIRTRGELDRLVAWILRRLEERRGLGEDLGATRRWAAWCVREGLRRVEEEREERARSEAFLAQLAREAEEARRAWRAEGEAASRVALPRPRRPEPVPPGFTADEAWWAKGAPALRLPEPEVLPPWQAPVPAPLLPPGSAEDDARWAEVAARAQALLRLRGRICFEPSAAGPEPPRPPRPARLEEDREWQALLARLGLRKEAP